MAVSRADIDAVCAAYPGAVAAHPPELVSWKVGGKMFACFGGDGDMDGVSVKCPDVETARLQIEMGRAVRAPYFQRSWVRLPFADTMLDDARHRLGVSYDIIRASLKKAVRDTLPARKDS